MKTDRFDILEERIGRITKVVEDLQRKIVHIQRWISEQSDVVPLSARASANYAGTSKATTPPLTRSQAHTLTTVPGVPATGLTAQEVAKITGKSINLESANLYKLFLRGSLERIRVGRKVYYSRKRENRFQ